MKKTFVLAVLALVAFAAVSAQERMSDEERAKAIAERIEKAAERMAKDFDLKDDKKEAFKSAYVAFQKDMFSTNFRQARDDEEAEKKELTDAEATAKIQENISRQEQQIAAMQKRLEVQKKYVEEFSKTLTPQQVLKVISPQRMQGRPSQGQRQQGQRGQNAGGRGGFGGGFGGGF